MSQAHQRATAQSREHLIESHLPLVRALARRYTGLGAELDDLVQVGAVGLIKASDRFDPRKGVAFATFATPTIEGEIRHHLRDRSAGLRIPRKLQHLSREVRRCRGQLTNRLGRSPTVAELAAALDTDPDEVEAALVAERARESRALGDGDDTPVAAAGAQPADDADNRLMLVNSLRALDERERQVIYLRFHADRTERQIAGELKISQAHVSRLLGTALAKLRDSLVPASGLERGSPTDITPEPVISPVFAESGSSPSSTARRPNQAASPPRAAAPGPQGVRRPPATREPLERLRDAIEVWLAAERESPGGTPAAGARAGPRPAEIGADSAPARPGRGGGAASEAGAPSQKASSGHSGRFLVRMPSELHNQLASAAEREHVSLNQFVTSALATAVSTPLESREKPPISHPGPVSPAVPPPARTFRLVLAANLAVVVLAVAVAVVLLLLALERGI